MLKGPTKSDPTDMFWYHSSGYTEGGSSVLKTQGLCLLYHFAHVWSIHQRLVVGFPQVTGADHWLTIA